MPSPNSLAVSLSSLSAGELAEVLRGLTEADAEELLYDWRLWARPEQLAPASAWWLWMVEAGRGFGKTRSGAQWVIHKAHEMPRSRGALVGRTAADVRDTMIEGESGILACSPPWRRPRYEPSKRRLTWPNGSMATAYSADEPNLLRGPQHHWAWSDETAAWAYEDAWDQLMFGLRLSYMRPDGPSLQPQCVITTTPKRRKFLRALKKDPGVVVTKGSTYANKENLSPVFMAQIVRKYEGTTLGRQELEAEELDDVPGALWKLAPIEAARVKTAPELSRVVVAIDPSASSGPDSDEAGIMVCGRGRDGRGYVLSDLSGTMSPDEWATVAVKAYKDRKADRVIAETNQGGDMVELTLRTVDRSVAYRGIHAKRGKALRAEPVAALYEQGRVSHVGAFPYLEDQLCSWVPGSSDSPDRLDALVYALTELLVEPGADAARGMGGEDWSHEE
jgi:phage terminase large subunit-like protein